MVENIAQDYSKYLKLDMQKKTAPVSQTIDDMLIRLEEFEAMVAIVQEQRCNSMGLTGALPEVAESLPDLKDLCDKIGMLEKMIQHAMAKVNELETKMETAEEEFGLVDNANKIKNLLAPMFKKGNISRQSAVPQEEVRDFVADDYFVDDTSH